MVFPNACLARAAPRPGKLRGAPAPSPCAPRDAWRSRRERKRSQTKEASARKAQQMEPKNSPETRRPRPVAPTESASVERPPAQEETAGCIGRRLHRKAYHL